MGGIDEIGYSGQSGSLWLNGKRCERKGMRLRGTILEGWGLDNVNDRFNGRKGMRDLEWQRLSSNNGTIEI